jgi:branched-chain amino acid transport system permease protein
MDSFAWAGLNILLHGVAYAMILYIVSVGLTVTMGLMGFANLAHGVFAVAGGYVLTRSTQALGVPFEVGLVLSFVLVGAGSILFERLLYRPLYEASELDQVLLSMGLIFVSIAVAKFSFGPETQFLKVPLYLKESIVMGDRSFPTYRLFIIASSAVMVTALWLILERTDVGARIRAAVDNRAMSESIGINTDKLFMFTFSFGSGLAGLGGALGAELLPINPGYALQHLVLFLMVVSIGGLGSLKGSFVAALVLGVGDTAIKFLLPEAGTFYVYVAAVLVLLWRPQGLYGRAS